MNTHISVMPEQALAALSLRKDGCYVDATFGRGGHSALILTGLSEAGRLLAIDQDPEARQSAAAFADDHRFTFLHGNFSDLTVLLADAGVEHVDGVLMDLGVSSPQLDDAERGFSFQNDGPLDMRMNTEAGRSAADYIATVRESDLVDVLFKYGEEKFARRIAAAIVSRRSEKRFERTADLAAVVAAANPRWEKHKNPATRAFQAIRIAVNGELDALESGLKQAFAALAPGGRLVVISFHSLEDRIVKRYMRQQTTAEQVPKWLPVIPPELRPKARLVAKKVTADAEELASNTRARSATLRAVERLTDAADGTEISGREPMQ